MNRVITVKLWMLYLLTMCISIAWLNNNMLAHPATSIVFQNQDKEDKKVLFSFGEDKVSKAEFVRVYEKHNAQDTALYSQQSVEDYLDLYIKFKLKVKEAEEMGLADDQDIVNQLKGYREQLAKNYLYDRKITEKLMAEAYDHMQKEVRTSHILFMVGADASPQDTLKAYNLALGVRDQIVAGGDFTELARQHSKDPSVKDNDGDLGYITAFQTVYPFEWAAYHTPIGDVSMPVRTKFGYHLVKAQDIRPARGEVQVAHILIKVPKKANENLVQAAKDKIDKIATQLAEGKEFKTLAQQFSEDKKTARRGGTLPKFSSGQMLPEFEEAAFMLKEVGAVSAPFQTKLGWHIIQLMDKETVGAYEEVEAEIKKKIKRDSRSRVSEEAFLKKLKKEYQFKSFPENSVAVKELIDKRIMAGAWRFDPAKAKEGQTFDQAIFELTLPNGETQKYDQQTFLTYVQVHQKKAKSQTLEATFNRLVKNFEKDMLLDVEKGYLEEKHPEFAQLMQEFRDGTLLFELTEQKVWNKALQDTTGLQQFHANHADRWQWAERAEATIFKAKDMEIAEKTKKMIGKKKVNVAKIVKEVNSLGVTSDHLTATTELYEKGQNEWVDQVEWKKGKVSDFIKHDDGTVSLVRINKMVAPTNKELKEVRGYVVADYQAELEKAWIEELKKKYPIEVNKKVLKSIYK